MGRPDELEYVEAHVGGVPDDAILEVLTTGLAPRFSPVWLDWKHRRSPWGRSRVVLVSDAEGPLAVALSMPWRFRLGERVEEGQRMVDAATLPRARRRGVFRRVMGLLVAPLERADGPVLAVTTALPAAQRNHIANGATALDPIAIVDRPLRPARAALVHGVEVLEGFPVGAPPPTAGPARVRTAWDLAALRWRLDPRFGRSYRVARLAASDAAHGAVYCATTMRGVPALALTATWGAEREQRALLRALAWRHRAPVATQFVGPGTPVRRPRPARGHGSSLVCVWEAGRSREPAAHRREGWVLDGLDLEGYL